MITAVDSNILIDIIEPDPEFGPTSREYLKRCRKEGAIVACEIVWAEIATSNALEISDLVLALDRIGLEFSPATREVTLKAAICWRTYRQEVPGRNRIAADFLIGAHAQVTCDRLLTRDRGFYRRYFEGLTILDPTAA